MILTFFKIKFAILGALVVPCFGRVALHGTNSEHDLYRYIVPFIIGGISGFLIGLMKDRWLVTNKAMKQEIEEHKLSRQALQKSNEESKESAKRFLHLSESLADTVYEFDPKGKFTYLNEAGIRIFGYSKDELKNIQVQDTIAKEDNARSKKAIGKIFKGEVIVAERTFIRKDGSTFIGEIHSGPIYKKKNVIGVRGLIRDITERKQAEAEKEKLIKQLQGALEDVKTLSGLLPICAKCKKIRDDKGCWNDLEGYIQTHSDAEFSHGICPECSDKLYGDEGWYIDMKNKKEKK